jgi:hypothetical protein
MDIVPGAGALLVRAWVDEGRLKARLILLVEGETQTLAMVGREAVLAAVGRWLEHLEEGRPPGGDATVTPSRTPE